MLVLTDANVFFAPDTLFELVKHFHNPAIGLVGGNILNPNHRAKAFQARRKPTWSAKT